MDSEASTSTAIQSREITLPQAALLAGAGLLAMVVTAPVAELYIYPQFNVSGSTAETAQRILANKSLFVAAIFCYLVTFLCDVLVAWALYVLLKPVSASLSMLTAWFRLVYTVIALFALSNLVVVLRLLSRPRYLTELGPDELYAQVSVLLGTFGHVWGFGFIFFAIHLGLLSYLVYRSSYIPRVLGVLLAINGLGYFIDYLGPYLYPNVDLGFLMITFFGEVFFMFWLLIRGWRIEDPS